MHIHIIPAHTCTALHTHVHEKNKEYEYRKGWKCSLVWPQACYVVENGLELPALLPLPTDYRHSAQHPVLCSAEDEIRGLCMQAITLRTELCHQPLNCFFIFDSFQSKIVILFHQTNQDSEGHFLPTIPR